MKKFCPDQISRIKIAHKREWENWKALIQQVARQLGMPFAKPHIESWTNGWQVRAHFFAYFKYEFHQNSAVILSVLLNRRRLSVSLDWHCYRADRSQINLSQYNQWLDAFDFKQYSDFELWHGDESEYADFSTISELTAENLLPQHDEDFFCIGRNIEKAQIDQINVEEFIVETIRNLLPLYEKCHC